MTGGNKANYNVGDIVLAVAGRDSERLFLVVGILDESYVYIANGKSRKADSPKKKKIRHIKLLKKAENNFIESLNLKNGKFNNSVLRKIISEFKEI
ncbi:MAG: KOW domain-containing RNA-binding protein [Oscillospiraceae bacterium]|nr:KOW domain-containing RNA-binding protein [Oscillospiraceae bacterium]